MISYGYIYCTRIDRPNTLYSPWTKQFRIVGDLTGIQNI